MKSKIFLILLLGVAITVVLFFVANNKETSLVSSVLKQDVSKESTPLPEASSFTQPQNNPPRSFQFNESTDLKKELESINPQVLDTDFE